MIATDSDVRPHDEAANASVLPPDTLFVLRPVGDSAGMAPVALAAGRHVIGSAAACDVRFDVTGVEAKHCLIVTGPNRAVIRAYEPDTLLNGAAVTESPLAIGDVLSVGPIELRLEGPDQSDVGAVLRDVQDQFAVRDEAEQRLKRWREDLLRRENDLAIAAAALRNNKALPPVVPATNDNPDERFAHVNRLRRRVSEMTAEVSAAQADLLARERTLRQRSEHLETWLASAATVEARCRQEEQQIADERAQLRAAQDEHAKRTAELDTRAASLDERRAELDQIVADIAAREQAIVEDANSIKAGRAQLAVDRAAITTQQDVLRTERDRLAKERIELADERELLRLEVADLARHREEANAQIEIALEELQHMEAMQRTADEHDEAERAIAESQRAAEIELAWRERDFELREMELNWQRSELNEKSAELARRESERLRDEEGFREWQASSLAARELELTRREQELDHLLNVLSEEQASRERSSAAPDANVQALEHAGGELADWQARLQQDQQSLAAVTAALSAERAALRAEEARFNAARREFADERERFAASVRADLARRDAEAALAVAASSLETLAAPSAAPASAEPECVVDVAANVADERSTADAKSVADSLRELEDALATLFDTSDDPSLSTDIIAAESNAHFWTALETSETPIKVGGVELDDANNPESVARYMQELLQRVREDNPLVPPRPTADGDDPGDTTLRTASAVLYEPFEWPIPRQSLDKEHLRAQTDALRGVANLSARTAIQQHSLRMRKAELFAKGVLTAIAVVIGGFLMAVYARFGSAYLWHLVAGFATVIFVMYDFLVSFQKLSEASRPVERPESQENEPASQSNSAAAEATALDTHVSTEPQREPGGQDVDPPAEEPKDVAVAAQMAEENEQVPANEGVPAAEPIAVQLIIAAVEAASVEETSVEETSVEETSVEEASVEETSVEEASVEAAVVEQTVAIEHQPIWELAAIDDPSTVIEGSQVAGATDDDRQNDSVAQDVDPAAAPINEADDVASVATSQPTDLPEDAEDAHEKA